jgi:hypothetical protein
MPDPGTMLRGMLERAQQILEGTTEGLTAEQLHWQPGGTANPIAAGYAHVVLGEDRFVQGLIGAKPTLYESTWSGRTGLSALPAPGGGWDAWARELRMDLPQFKAYAQAVHAETRAFLERATDADLDRIIEHRFFGPMKVGDLVGLIAIHTATHAGDIGAIKGVQGLTGLGF